MSDPHSFRVFVVDDEPLLLELSEILLADTCAVECFSSAAACLARAEQQVPDLFLLDVRSADMFMNAHIPTAVNIPLADLTASLNKLPKDKLIVAYCGNLTCALAPKAALELAQKGFEVKQLTGGLELWQEKGFPVQKKH